MPSPPNVQVSPQHREHLVSGAISTTNHGRGLISLSCFMMGPPLPSHAQAADEEGNTFQFVLENQHVINFLTTLVMDKSTARDLVDALNRSIKALEEGEPDQ